MPVREHWAGYFSSSMPQGQNRKRRKINKKCVKAMYKVEQIANFYEFFIFRRPCSDSDILLHLINCRIIIINLLLLLLWRHSIFSIIQSIAWFHSVSSAFYSACRPIFLICIFLVLLFKLSFLQNSWSHVFVIAKDFSTASCVYIVRQLYFWHEIVVGKLRAGNIPQKRLDLAPPALWIFTMDIVPPPTPSHVI